MRCTFERRPSSGARRCLVTLAVVAVLLPGGRVQRGSADESTTSASSVGASAGVQPTTSTAAATATSATKAGPTSTNLLARSDGAAGDVPSPSALEPVPTSSAAPPLTPAPSPVPAAAPLRGGVNRGLLLGVHQDLTWESSAPLRMSRIAAAQTTLHAEASRDSLLWSQVEPERGVRDWRRVDAVVNELGAAGIVPVFFIVGSPSWANGIDPAVPDASLYVPTQQAAFDAWVQSFAQFAHDAALRYRGRIVHWSIWNEPNNPDFYKPTPDATRYAHLYTVARAAILSADPSAVVAAGEINALQAEAPGGIRGLDFLQTLLALRVPMDALAIHPYASAGQAPDAEIPYENNFRDIRLVEAALTADGRSQTPIWVTEWGWDTRRVSPVVQAADVRRSLEMLRDLYPNVSVAIYFLDCDRFYPTVSFTFGLLNSDLTPKPAASAFREFAESLSRT